MGDVFRRVVAWTMAQQYTEAATAPHQYAFKTKAGCETVAHILQVLTDLDPHATVVSVDGVGAFDLISLNSMVEGLRRVVDGEQILPFVSSFCGQLSTYLWEDDGGEVCEGGDQSGTLCPCSSPSAPCSLRSVSPVGTGREALRIPRRFVHRLQTGGCWSRLQPSGGDHSRIPLHSGKTKVWNRSGVFPSACVALQSAAESVQTPTKVQGSRHTSGACRFRATVLGGQDCRAPSPVGENP